MTDYKAFEKGFCPTKSENYKDRYVCNGCGCLTTHYGNRCVNENCKYYAPGIFAAKQENNS